MPLTGIQIYKLLPQTNCKDCGYPTCLAFAMKLAAKQAELTACPHVSDASKAQLAELAAPPMRLVSIKSNGHEVKAGNETVIFRHEKTFYNQPGIMLRIADSETTDAIQARVSLADAYKVAYVGKELAMDGFAIEAISNSADDFSRAIEAVRSVSKKPLVLIAKDPDVLAAGLKHLGGETPLMYAATADNWEALAGLAKNHPASLVVSASNLDELADLTQKIKGRGVEDLVLDFNADKMGPWLTRSVQVRRLALKKNVRALGYPTIAFPGRGSDPAREARLAAQAVAKYAGFIILEHFHPATLYPLLVLRQNIYTDPQKPIQMQPGLYPINDPKPDDPVLVTTNFSITYFSVANEVEGAGNSAWLLVTDSGRHERTHRLGCWKI